MSTEMVGLFSRFIGLAVGLNLPDFEFTWAIVIVHVGSIQPQFGS